MWRRGSTYIILIGNLLPLFGLSWFAWDPLTIATFYWAEALMILFSEWIQPWLDKPWRPYRPVRRLAICSIVGFGILVVLAFETVLMTAIVSMDALHQAQPLDTQTTQHRWPGPLFVLGWLWDVATWLFGMMDKDLIALLVIYAIGQTALILVSMVLHREALETRVLSRASAEPLVRLATWFCMLLAIFMFWMAEWTVAAVQLLIVIKVTAELSIEYHRHKESFTVSTE